MQNRLRYCFFLFISLHISATAQIKFAEKALVRGVNHTYIIGQVGGGISFVDFNNDGLDDLTMGTAKGELIHFYRNTGTGFARNPPLIGNSTEQKQILWADYDNDGDKDLFVCSKGDINRYTRIMEVSICRISLNHQIYRFTVSILSMLVGLISIEMDG